MPQHSTDTVCGLVGVLPETLRRWRRAGLLTPPGPAGYSDNQLTRALCVREMTSGGHTLFDIHTALNWSSVTLPGGWAVGKRICCICWRTIRTQMLIANYR